MNILKTRYIRHEKFGLKYPRPYYINENILSRVGVKIIEYPAEKVIIKSQYDFIAVL